MSLSDNLVSSVKPASKAFHAKIDGLLMLLTFAETARRLRPRLGALVDQQRLDAEHRSMLSDFLNSKDVDNHDLAEGAAVVAYGALEQYMRKLMEESVRSINKAKKAFDDLGEQLRNEHVFRTGRALVTIRQPKDHAEFSYPELGKNLGSCDTGSLSYKLNVTTFSYEHGMFTVDGIERFVERIGITINWDRVGANAEIKKLLRETKTRDCAKAVRARIDQFVRLRNFVCHTGMADAAQEFRWAGESLRLLKLFVDSLTEIVATALQKKYQ